MKSKLEREPYGTDTAGAEAPVIPEKGLGFAREDAGQGDGGVQHPPLRVRNVAHNASDGGTGRGRGGSARSSSGLPSCRAPDEAFAEARVYVGYQEAVTDYLADRLRLKRALKQLLQRTLTAEKGAEDKKKGPSAR